MGTILSISSRVVRGCVGNTLASFALQRLGHEVWEVPTVVWDRHPGLGPPTGLTIGGRDLAGLLADFREPGQARRIGMVLTGYFATPEQIAVVRDFIRGLRADGHAPHVCCDPVSADAPGPYVALQVIEALRRDLVPLADSVTPNRYELGHLAGLPVDTIADVVAAARALGRPLCLVTSAPAASPETIADALVAPDGAWRCEVQRRSGVPHGTGDLMTALFAAHLAHGEAPATAMACAASGVAAVLAATPEGADALALVPAQDALAGTSARPPIETLSIPEAGPRHGR